MRQWLRGALAVAAGFIVWFAVATVGNFVIRWLVPSYSEVEKAMDFSLTMMVARLILGAIASLVAGAACITIARGTRPPVYVLVVLLLALFVPVHVNLWAKFPAWYHIVFLSSLVVLVVLGARLGRSRTASAV